MRQIAVAELFRREQQRLLFNPTLMAACYTTTITVKGDINTVHIAVGDDQQTVYARTLGTLVGTTFTRGAPVNSYTVEANTAIVNIIRSAAPPLTLSPNKLIGGNAPFKVTLTSTQAITLTSADLKVVGGSIDSLTPDAARKVWTVTIRPGVGIAQITVEPSTTGMYLFPKGTFTRRYGRTRCHDYRNAPGRRGCVSHDDHL